MLEHPCTSDVEPLIQKVTLRKRRAVDDDADWTWKFVVRGDLRDDPLILMRQCKLKSRVKAGVER